MLLVSSVGSIIDEILLVRAWVVLVKKEGCHGAAPLMLETVRAAVLRVVGISTGAVRRILLVAEKLILELVSAVISPIAKNVMPRGGGAIDK
jgi:hypothetical protein